MRRVFFMMACLTLFITAPVLASTDQFRDFNRQHWYNNLTDSVHTFGKSPAQARAIKAQLRHKRYLARRRAYILAHQTNNN